MEKLIRLRELLDSLAENDPCSAEWKFYNIRGLIIDNYDILPSEAQALAGKDIKDCTIRQFIRGYCAAYNTIRDLHRKRRSKVFPAPASKKTLSVSETAAQVVEDKAVGSVDLT